MTREMTPSVRSEVRVQCPNGHVFIWAYALSVTGRTKKTRREAGLLERTDSSRSGVVSHLRPGEHCRMDAGGGTRRLMKLNNTLASLRRAGRFPLCLTGFVIACQSEDGAPT